MIEFIGYRLHKWTSVQIRPYIKQWEDPTEGSAARISAQSQSRLLDEKARRHREPPLDFPELLALSIKVVLACLENLLKEWKSGSSDLGPGSNNGAVIAFRQAIAVFLFILLGHRHVISRLFRFLILFNVSS